MAGWSVPAGLDVAAPPCRGVADAGGSLFRRGGRLATGGRMRRASRYQLVGRGLTACQSDQRFSYALFCPPAILDDPARHPTPDLIVSIHGSGRKVHAGLEAFTDLAMRHDAVVLAPLFPIGIGDPLDADAYKYIADDGLRYDRLLLDMIAETGRVLGRSFGRTVMFGFSGGGQFAHRFLLLHPHRLTAVSIGAPGKVTLPGDARPWWIGTGDMASRFGSPLDLAALRSVAVQLIVGAADTETEEIALRPGDTRWRPGAGDAGVTRVDRLRSLHAAFERAGVEATLDILPGVGHRSAGPIVSRVCDFFESVLARPDYRSTGY